MKPHQGSTYTELARLRRRVAELEELCGLDETIDPHFLEDSIYHRSRIEAIIKLLVARPLISEFAIGLAIGCEDLTRQSAGVYVHLTRKALAKNGLNGVIKNDFGNGWYVSNEDKPKLRALIVARPEARARA